MKLTLALEELRNDPVLFLTEILGVTPWHKQEEIAYSVRDNKYTLVYSGHSVGKALAVSTKIPTPHGFVPIGSLRPGDHVYDETGDPCNVTWVSPIETPEKTYRITFSDGTMIEACSEHQWYVENDSERRKRSRYGVSTPGKVRTTQEIYEGNVAPKRGTRMWSIPIISAPVEFPRRKLPVDPYTLGVWLGDGTAGTGAITNRDPEVWEKIGEKYRLGPDHTPERNSDYRTVKGLSKLLREAGIFHEKRVPPAYLTASKEQRLELLRGLLDSDGSCDSRGSIEFCNTNKKLADAVFTLAASLGFKPNRPVARPAKLYGVRKKDRYRVVFRTAVPCFHITRKAARQRPPSLRVMHRMITSIEPCEPTPMRCIAVDSPRNLYLATDAFIPTHNSFVTACMALWFVCTHPDAIVLTTANTWSQVKDVVWREMRKLHRDAIYPIGGSFKPKHPEFTIGDNIAFGFSPSKPDSAQGHHRDNVLIIFDEAQGILDQGTWDAFSSMMTSRGSKQLVIGNPLYSQGPFYLEHMNPKWNAIQMSCLDHPNYLTGRNIIPGAVTRAAIEEIRQDPLKAPGTQYWDVRIAGIFPEDSGNAVLPLAWLEQCTNLPKKPGMLPGTWIGFDPAHLGADRCVCLVIKEGVIKEIEAWRRCSAEKSVNKVLMMAARHNVPMRHINYDASGGVGGTFQRAFQGAMIPAHPVHLGTPPVGDWEYFFGRGVDLQFLNRRAELHWAMRRLFEEQKISVPAKYQSAFKMESCNLQYGFFDTGKLYIESKDRKFIPRMKFSPDHNDALIVALARDQGDPETILGSADYVDTSKRLSRAAPLSGSREEPKSRSPQ